MKATPISLILALLGVLHAQSALADESIRFFGRSVQLDPYLAVSGSVFVDQRAERIYLEKVSGSGMELAFLSLPADGNEVVDLAAARSISPVDVSKRNVWGAGYSKVLDRTLVLTDRAGEERINLYTIEPNGDYRQLTDVGYIYGWSMSPDGRWLVYSSRESVEFSPGTIILLDLESGRERVLFRDSRSLRPYWSTPVWKADSSAFLLTVVLDEDRTLQNVAQVAVSGPEAGKPAVVTDPAVHRQLILPKSAWIDEQRFVYLSRESGTYRLYVADAAGRTKELAPEGVDTTAGEQPGQLKGAMVARMNGNAYIVTLRASALRDTVRVIDLPSRRVVYERSVPDVLRLVSSLDGRVILTAVSQTDPASVIALTAVDGAFRMQPLARYARASEDVVHCTPEKISFPTFDGLSAPGEDGTLHAWLYRPRDPLPKSKATLVIEAFYGGSRGFNSIYPLPVAQLFCSAGMHFLSPAPRGSEGMGPAFRDLIRGDLGGNEILDIGWAAKWGQRELAIPPERTGAFGLSHGGYATMRLLTLPEEVNGQSVDFRFGFGISDAGISNLSRHAANSNIRGWSVYLMGGAPEESAGKWLDRSPLAHADRLSVPLLLLHGTNDRRVDVLESRSVAQRLRELEKPVRYVELPGAGHNSRPVPQLRAYWRSVFDFVQDVVEQSAADASLPGGP